MVDIRVLVEDFSVKHVLRSSMTTNATYLMIYYCILDSFEQRFFDLLMN